MEFILLSLSACVELRPARLSLLSLREKKFRFYIFGYCINCIS